jgi:hypothetical protein
MGKGEINGGHMEYYSKPRVVGYTIARVRMLHKDEEMGCKTMARK